ncbi:MAG: glycosyl hydrolase family 8 [Candidatus Cyclobacteriaceae bacterium M3_2C_046]
MKKLSLQIILWMAIPALVYAQSKPFPQNVEYDHGFTSNAISNSTLQGWYDYWLANAFARCGQDELIKFGYENSNEAVSEGIAYGMLITAYFGNREKFDNLWAYYKRMMNENGLMMWHTTCSGAYPEQYSETAASDAEIDAAYALLVAHDQWGGNYKNESITLIDAIKQYETATCGDLSILKPGEWGGCNEMHVDYFDPGYYRVFYEATGDNFWADMANDAYVVMNRAAHSSTGLIPEMCDINGTPVTKTTFGAGSCRLLWRVTRDYLWYGESQAKNLSDDMTNWGNGIGIQNIVGEYNINGTPLVSWRAAFVTGAFAVGAMSHSQSRTDSWADFFETDNVILGYYNLELRILYALTLTGNYWKPGTTSTPATYTLTVNNGSGDGTYQSGTVVNISADTAPTGQQFSNWTGATANIADINDVSTTLTMPAANITVTANYETILSPGLSIPGIIEAENYSAMNGIQTQPTTDTGGGENIGWVDTGDWLDYNVEIPAAGEYNVTFRLASLSNGAKFDLKIGSATLTSVDEPATSGWQNWTSVTKTVNLQAGSQTLRIVATGSGWNLNWMDFSENTSQPTYTLTVNNGTGDGSYEQGAQVTVTANAAPSGQEFTGWTGDTQYLSDPSAANTIMTMPNSNVSISASYSSTTTSCNNSTVPSPSNWILRNNWSNQNGSNLSNESNTLKISYPQWGKNEFYLIQQGVNTSITAGQEYAVSFEIKGSSVASITGVSVGFSDGYSWSGPTGYAIDLNSAGGSISNSSFTSKEITLLANENGSGMLTLQISLSGQPNKVTAYYLKNVSICRGSSDEPVEVPVTGISVSPSSFSLSPGDVSILSAAIAPTDATNKNISWSSDNTAVATVNASGSVNAVAAGTAVITATTSDGGYISSSTVSVTGTTSSNTLFEAEDASLSGCSVASSISGFSGTGYVNGSTFTNPDEISWTINGIQAGDYNLVIGYNGNMGAKQQELIINGNSMGYVNFNNIDQWSTVEAGTYRLNANNTIKLKAYWGWMHVDYIEIISSANGRLREPLKDQAEISVFELYPNPVEGSKNLMLRHGFTDPVKITIMDLQGKLVYSQIHQNEQIINIPTKDLGKGIYVFKINEKVEKFMVK